ncbi:PREDICTED: LOW QUALITY PROTEIN: sterile alpha motif domain-containing protein 3 [Gekko japonicus]|uniref:LOW QUALITY PROTEIN: sterile alpha motif domain-containing protein 3 n=1 Tax=Gekko japonicus TaxID=146911 RepID=A0ABM1JZF3_GEKJA|nr:PREDICTED: LOW QUALITY PROTEIN: sterile alpha motif domain-containing protein 3 [Gekko japonicus]
METWSVDEVCIWLVQKNVGEQVPKFRKEEVRGAAPLALNDRMIQQLVKKTGHQAVLMDLITKCKQQTKGSVFTCESPSSQSPGAMGGLVVVLKEEVMGLNPNWKFYSVLQDYFLIPDVWGPCRGRYVRWRHQGPSDIKDVLATRTQECGPLLLICGDIVRLEVEPEPQQNHLAPTESFDDGSVDQRVLKQKKKNMKHVLARYKALQWTNSYILPEFPYDVKCILAERKYPDHSMRIKTIEFLQADMTKYLEGSLYPTAQQYNDVVNGFLIKMVVALVFEFDVEMSEHINWFNEEYMKTEINWVEVDNRIGETLEIRRLFREFQSLAHKDICKKTAEILEKYSDNILTSYLMKNNPISLALQECLKQRMEDDVLKFMKTTTTCVLLPVVFGEDSFLFAAVNEEVRVSTPVLEVKYQFSVNMCEFSLFVEKEKLAQLDDCTVALAALLATYHAFCIPFPKWLYNTLTFLESLIFEVKRPQLLFVKYKRTQKCEQPNS